MHADVINPFIESTTLVFDTMLGCPLTRGTPTAKTDNTTHYEVTGIIGLSGAKASGMVSISLSEETALSATEALLGERPEEVDADVVDAIGELTNMIAGAAKAKLESLEMEISLPSVVTGKSHTIAFPSRSVPITVPFESQWGPLVVDVALIVNEEVVPSDCRQAVVS